VIVRRQARLVWAGAVFLSLLALSGREARAAPLTVRLEYAAGPGCPDAADFKTVVITRLGYDPFMESAPERVLVRIEPRTGTIDGRIEWRDASGKWAGEQAFPSVSTDCPRLVRAMGFALAVQIQLLARAAAVPDANVVAPAETGSPPQGPAIAEPPIATMPPPEAPTIPARRGCRARADRRVGAAVRRRRRTVGRRRDVLGAGHARASVRRARVAALLGRAGRRREPARDDPTR
jgi:hypothetical protein